MNRRDRRIQALLRAGRRLPGVEAELAAARADLLKADDKHRRVTGQLQVERSVVVRLGDLVSRLEDANRAMEAEAALQAELHAENEREMAHLRHVVALRTEEAQALRAALVDEAKRYHDLSGRWRAAERELKRLRPLAGEDMAKLRRRLRERSEELAKARREIRRLRGVDQTSARSEA